MKRLFLIAPYSDSNFSIKQQIVQEICKQYKFKMIAGKIPDFNIALSINETFEILEEVDCVISDLTFERPSCYYELGVAHALKKNTLILASSKSKIHFLRYPQQVQYFSSLEDYRKLISKYLASVNVRIALK